MNYSGQITPVQPVAETITRRKVRLIELVNINLIAGTAIYVHQGTAYEVKRSAAGWFTTGEVVRRPNQ